MKYLATINTPGYLPWDDDPPTFDTAREAWDYLADARRNAEDDDLEREGEGYSDTLNTLEMLAQGSTDPALGVDDDGTGWVQGNTPGYDGDHDLGLAYHVTLCEPCEEHSEFDNHVCTTCGALEDCGITKVVITIEAKGAEFIIDSNDESHGARPEYVVATSVAGLVAAIAEEMRLTAQVRERPIIGVIGGTVGHVTVEREV